jgi:hypothetical protein
MTKAEVQQLVVAKATQYGVDPRIALGIAAHESGFNDQAVNRANPNGTVDWGVMQLNDTTVKTMGVSNPLDPVQNVDAGVRLLASLLNRYSGDERLALWAYASGPGNVGPTKTPNTIAQNFITYVENYQGGAPAVPGSVASPELPVFEQDYTPVWDDPTTTGDNGVSEAGSVNWGIVAVLGLGLLAIWWMTSD